MGKGSQLSQLKSALSQAGLSRQSQPGRKRRRAQTEEKDHAKRAARLREIQQKLNPFDVKVTKLKHDVGGRKLKGVSGKPAQSKQAGIEARKKTLLKEFEEKDRAGGILDRRFGENDPTLTPEERMLERFTRERQRASKGAAFNLEDEVELTHYGQSLSRLDDFADAGLELESDEEAKGQIDGETVKKSHFGGFESESADEDEDEPARKKTKAEVMDEVMAKSKEYKALRQKQREEADDVRHQLDQELDAIRGLLSGPDPLSESLERKLGSQPDVAGEDRDRQYDQFVRELVFDQRSKPKDRSKTEEELALEAKLALEKAERQRIRRMNGEDSAESSGEEGRPVKRRRLIGGDDLEDDFDDDADDRDGLGRGLISSSDSIGEEGSSVDDGREDDSESEDETGVDHDSEPPWYGLDSPNLSGAERKAPQGPKSSHELPYTFPCPSSHEEFLDILEGVVDQDVPTVVERIRALHHPSLGIENGSKLQVFAGVLIDHILYVASPSNPRISVVSGLLPHIRALTKTYPRQTAEHFIGKLVLMHKNLKRGLSHGARGDDAKTWPGLPELVFLRVLGVLWPTSDMRHAVVSPVRLLMGSYLALCKYENRSGRFVPEAINFLTDVICSLSPPRDISPGSERSPSMSQRHNFGRLCLDMGKARTLSVSRPNLVAVITDKRINAQTNVDLLGLAVDLLARFSQSHKTLEGFIELYEPVLQMLCDIDSDVLCPLLRDQISRTIDTTERLIRFSHQARRPLCLQAHKPIPIPSYTPKFESTSSSYLRTRDPDHERQEASKLRRQYKEERKGAIRELRKDARFLARVEQEKQGEKDRSYHERMKKVFGSIEVERAEEKALEREKAREKRRAGRK